MPRRRYGWGCSTKWCRPRAWTPPWEQAGLFLRCAPGAIAATKRLLAFVDRHEASENLDYTVRSAAEMWATAEAAEGMQSFIEKRKPAWAR